MNKILKNSLLVLLSICLVVSTAFAVGLILFEQSDEAFAETANESSLDNVAVTDTADEVLAEYQFTAINDKECSVRISNKSEATKAVIPSNAEINGKTYKVTQVAANGFMSSAKLKRVSLPYTVIKVGNLAFANCQSLERISLANVKELGSYVFYKCTSLGKLVLPDSIVKMGGRILCNADTQVLARSATAQEGWLSNWNDYNANQDVEFGSKYQEPLELETVYARSTATRSTEEGDMVLEGYVVASGQPFSSDFYAEELDGLFIPSTYNDKYILGIASGAFEGTSVSKLVVEYSTQPMWIADDAFAAARCENIIINRPVEFANADGTPSRGIFAEAKKLKAVALPDTVAGLASETFYDCTSLTNIYFFQPYYTESRSDMIQIVDKLAKQGEEGVVKLPHAETFTSLGDFALANTAIKKLHVFDNVQKVGVGIMESDYDNNRAVWVHMAQEELRNREWHKEWSRGITAKNLHFESEIFYVLLDPCGGQVSTTFKEVVADEKIGDLPIPELAHHVFLGWYDAEGILVTSETIFEQECDLQLFAHWQEFTYTVAYNANRPTNASNPVVGAMTSRKVTHSELFSLQPNAFSIVGWSFVSWNTQQDGLGNSFADEAEVSRLGGENGSTVVLYAQWKQNTCTIVFDTNRPDTFYQVEGQMAAVEVGFEESHKLGCNFSLKGWKFDGWNTRPDGKGESYSVNATLSKLDEEDGKTITLYAQWKVKEYKIVFTCPYGFFNKYSYVTTYTVDTEIVFDAYEIEGYYVYFEIPIIEKGSTGDKEIKIIKAAQAI